MKDTYQPLTKWQLLAYALPAMPLAALYSPITVYLPPFYGTEMGLGLGVVGTIFLLARFWDLLTDPVLGVITDRVPSRWGRRRHWIVLSVPMLVLSVAMVFLPRQVMGSGVSATYLLLWLMFLYIWYTIATLSQYSWAAELTEQYDERSRILGWREFFHLFGMLMVLGLPAAAEILTGSTLLGDKVAVMGIFFLVMMPLTVAIAVSSVPEYRRSDVHQPSIREGWRLLVASGPMRRILLTDLMVGIPGGVMGSLYVFFASDVVDAGRWLTVILLGFFGAGLVGVPLMVRMSYRMQKHNAIIVCKLVMIVVTASFLFLQPGDVIAFAALIATAGFIFNGLHVMLRSITADIVDRDLLQTGAVRTGLFYALLTMTSKVGYALALLTYPLLDWLGYKGSAGSSAGSIDALRLIFVLVPIAALVLGIALMWRFPFGREEHQRVRAQLAERRN